ncbi:MAG: hypothetical protein ACXVAX_05250 [Pseudobdellovibrio sp.]
MKAIGEIMHEMGFNKTSSLSAQEAFLRHLIKASSGADVQICATAKKSRIKSRPQAEPSCEQLSFDLNDHQLKTAI